MPRQLPDSDYEQRLQTVVAMRQQGVTFAQIGRELGVTKQRAYQLFEEAGRCRPSQRRLAASDGLEQVELGVPGAGGGGAQARAGSCTPPILCTGI